MTLTIYDREQQRDYFNNGGVGTPPRIIKPALCGSVFVQSIKVPGGTVDRPLEVTGSNNFGRIGAPVNGVSESGWLLAEFESRGLVGEVVGSEQAQAKYIQGLPVLGVSLYRFTNSGATEGLLAQYGGASVASSRVSVTDL